MDRIYGPLRTDCAGQTEAQHAIEQGDGKNEKKMWIFFETCLQTRSTRFLLKLKQRPALKVVSSSLVFLSAQIQTFFSETGNTFQVSNVISHR